jgi:hypothetical protein
MQQPEHPSVSSKCRPQVQEEPAPPRWDGLLNAYMLTLQGNQLHAKKWMKKETIGAGYKTTDAKRTTKRKRDDWQQRNNRKPAKNG